MSFLHGVEHIDLPGDFVPVNNIVTAVIGLVGSSDKGTANELTLCKRATDDAQFGTKGTIPEALKAIRMQDSKQGSALVLVIKVKSDSDTITGADIVGTVSELDERTGLKLFETALTKYAFEPMIYIVPRYSALAAVKQELIVITEKTGTMAYIDTPDGYTFASTLESRGKAGEFATLTEGQKLLFPHFLVPNPDYNPETPEITGKYLTVPMSAFAAGLRAKIDLEEGWHISSSNHRFTGVEGTDVALTFALSDKTCEANLLNAAGVTTAVNMYGRGILEWGNYTAGFPGNTAPEAFECVRRTRSIMKRTIEQASAPFIDVKQIRKADIDLIRNTINEFLNGLVSQGKIVDGECLYLPANNPVSELAQGHIEFNIIFTPAIPVQRITFTYKIDVSQLTKIE